MLVIFPRTFNYIFPYFFSLNNKYASRCAHRSFSAWHFPSAVDGWLSSHIDITALHHAYRSTCDSPLRSTIDPWLVLSHSSQIRPKSEACLSRLSNDSLSTFINHFNISESKGNEGPSLDANFMKVSTCIFTDLHLCSPIPYLL